MLSSLGAWAGGIGSDRTARRSRSFSFLLLAGMAALLLGITLVSLWSVAMSRPVAFVVMGSDNRHADGPSRSDAIFILRTDPSTGKIRGLSIPRDLYVPIHGLPLKRKDDRINSALFWGDYYCTRQGMEVACQTIRDLTRVPLKGALVVRFDLIRKMVDAMDGVEVYLDKPVCDRTFHPLAGGGSYTLRFESGWNYLDGDRALEFIRLRKPDTDFGRMNRNRQLINTLMCRLREKSSLFALFKKAPSMMREVETNLGFLDRVRIAWTCYELRDRPIEWHSIQRHEVSNATTPRGAQVLVPNEGVLLEAGRVLMGEPQFLARAVTP